jgi:hypothetical protein
VKGLCAETHELKELLAEQMVENRLLKKKACPGISLYTLTDQCSGVHGSATYSRYTWRVYLRASSNRVQKPYPGGEKGERLSG